MKSARTCGTCRACCTALRVEGIPDGFSSKGPDFEPRTPFRKEYGHPLKTHTKSEGATCQYLIPAKSAGPACTIYENRPTACREWSCMWLQARLDMGDRPDVLGLIFDERTRVPSALVQDFGEHTYAIHEVWEGASLSPLAADMIAQLARVFVVMIFHKDGRRGVQGPGIRAEVHPAEKKKHLPVYGMK